MGGPYYCKDYASVLGVGLDLTWDKHVKVMSNITTKLVERLFRYLSKCLALAVLIRLYQVLIHPHLENCPYLWDPSH